MVYWIRFYVGELQPCGMDYNGIINDLKTLRGVLNRIKKWQIKGDITKIEIYRNAGNNIYDNDNDVLVYSKEIPTSKEYFRSIEKYL